jgi:hypothetical protein
LVSGLALRAFAEPLNPGGDSLSEKEFGEPPISARPGAFWPWLNGSVSLAQITRELEEMKDKGMSGADIWDVGALSDPEHLIAAGPAFMGPESVQAIAHTIREGNRLGLQIGMLAASGWNAGGSWVKPEDAGKGLFVSTTRVQGPRRFSEALPFPKVPDNCPKGTNGLPVYFREIAVQALPASAERRLGDLASVIDLTGRMTKDGRLTWDVPAGEWDILRFVSFNTGYQLILPSPNSAGPMIDFLDPGSTQKHFQYLIDRILAGLNTKTFAGTSFHHMEVDSMELGEDTAWTETAVRIFQRDYGYDPLPYLAVLKGWKTARADLGERFLYDWKKHISDLFIASHYRTARTLLNRYGLELCAEAGGPGPPIWDTCPVDALKALGSVDIARGEFWVKHRGIWLVKEIASAAHIYGKRIVDAEAFTSWRHWEGSPYSYKQLADQAMCEGLNRFTFHTFDHSPEGAGLPGLAYHAGTRINVNQTWWPKARPYLYYLGRCCYLLQRGHFVGDVCYYYGDEAPNFVPAKSVAPSLGYGYDYDVVNTEVILDRMSVKDGRIVLPDGMSYALMVLPERSDMDLAVLKQLETMVKAGGTVVGPKPSRSNGLVDYPRRDEQVGRLAGRMWGECDGQGVKEQRYGKGRILWNRPLRDVLREGGSGPDFSYTGRDRRTALDYLHRRTGAEDIYFVINKTERWEDVDCVFRVKDKQPELWLPETGEVRRVAFYDALGAGTRVSLRLAPAGSVFVVFRERSAQGLPAGRQGRICAVAAHPAGGDDEPAPAFSHSITPNGPLWLSGGTGSVSNEFMVFDLGRSRAVEKLRIWNYNENVRGFLDRGVKDLRILVAADNGTFRDAGTFRLKQATETEDKYYSQDLPLAVGEVRYVKFEVRSNHGDRRYVGLSRVQFFGREEVEGVTVKEVSSGQAFDPKDDPERAEAYPALEAVPAGGDTYDVTIWKRGSYVLQDGRGQTQTVRATEFPPCRELTGPWEVRFPAGWGAPASQTFPALVPWPAVDHPSIKYFSGTAVYHKGFELPEGALAGDRQLVLDLGAVYDIADVYLNGKHLGIVWKPPFRVDITKAARTGTNALVVEVTNGWQNRLAGDGRLPKPERFTRSNMIYSRLSFGDTQVEWKDQLLSDSGLLGPVRIRTAKNMKITFADKGGSK